MTEDQPDWPSEPALAAELAVIRRLLRPARMTLWPVQGDALLEVGDLETAYVVAEQDGQGRLEKRHRDSVRMTLLASTVKVALRFLTYRLAEIARPISWPILSPSSFASNVTVSVVEDGQRLSWDGSWLLFPHGASAESEARPFSWVARATADEVAASYLELNGSPLFSIDLSKEAPEFPRVVPPGEPQEWYSPDVRRRDQPT
jgi:hypothetical protein